MFRKMFTSFICTDENIRERIKKYLNGNYSNYPPIGTWDVSQVTDMSNLFSGLHYFNEPLKNWDVSSVRNMECMFKNAKSFNQRIDKWQVNNVTNMKEMFCGASSFNQNINYWNIRNVKNMDYMFSGAISFNQPLGFWNVIDVSSMVGMFKNASSFNQVIGQWQISRYTNTRDIFLNCPVYHRPELPLLKSVEEPEKSVEEPEKTVEEPEKTVEEPEKTVEEPETVQKVKILLEELESTIEFNIDTDCFHVISGVNTIREAIYENVVFVFYDNNNPLVKVAVSESLLVEIKDAFEDHNTKVLNDYIVYENLCKDSMNSVVTNIQYFDIKKLTGFDSLILLSDMKIVLDNEYSLVILENTNRRILTTISDNTLYHESDIIDIPEDANKFRDVYRLMQNVTYTGIKPFPSGLTAPGLIQTKNIIVYDELDEGAFA
jgi:hypothetical protein